MHEPARLARFVTLSAEAVSVNGWAPNRGPGWCVGHLSGSRTGRRV